ncbi:MULTISPECIES: hypothetical protein [unclassified Meridianimarinicoccus]|uniref:hypothetical protein n=1 Tax=unclassified Meridianimarinicoccus TaxID=2923344 RepID=UPI00186718D0|nr:hypothetical protein [Fluviibacterium sp. MJW13]
MRSFVAVFASLLLSTATFAQDAKPEWGTFIGDFKKTTRVDGKRKSQMRPSFLRVYGEDCTEVFVETVTYNEEMWATKHPEDSGLTAAFVLKEIIANHPDMPPVCEQSTMVTRLVREGSDEELYFHSGNPIDLLAFNELTGGPRPDPIEPQADWGAMAGKLPNTFFDKSRQVRTERLRTWVQTHGGSCASLIVETILLGAEIRDIAGSEPTGTAAQNILDIASQRPDLLPPCRRPHIVARIIWEDNGRTRYWLGDDELTEEQFAALVSSDGATMEAEVYRNLASLPGGIDPFWGIYYKGNFGGLGTRPEDRTAGDRTVAAHAYHGIMRAYSNQVDANVSCLIPGDVKTTFSRTSQSDRNDPSTATTDPNAFSIYHPQSHAPMVRRAFEGEVGGLTRGWVRDGARILQIFGCRSDELQVLRENLRRYVEWEEPMSTAEANALLGLKQ